MAISRSSNNLFFKGSIMRLSSREPTNTRFPIFVIQGGTLECDVTWLFHMMNILCNLIHDNIGLVCQSVPFVMHTLVKYALNKASVTIA